MYSDKTFNTFHRIKLSLRQIPARNRLIQIILILASIQCLFWLLNPSASSSQTLSDTTTFQRIRKNIAPQIALHGGRQQQKLALVSVLTVPEKFERRSLIRSTYLQAKPAEIDFYFVFCRVKNPTYRTLVTLESRMYGDIIEMDCEENMDAGKTWSYFNHIASKIGNHSPETYDPTTTPSTPGPYKFIMKTDDDVYLHLPNLARRLSSLPPLGTYFGRRVPDRFFFAGMGYVLSWDLALYCGLDPQPAAHKIGQEDALLASWLRNANRIKNYVSEDFEIYDDPHAKKGWSHEYTEGTILIHRLKDEGLFLNAARHFLGVGAGKGDVGVAGRGMLDLDGIGDKMGKEEGKEEMRMA
ncbi:hypothetical protein HDV00_001398 [Rhizophlyctis rosea]|nr:hypothetical protein HDV00_001398 [Rhizophlyctis rosea]